MRPSFRAKLMIVVAIAASAFLLSIATDVAVARRVDRQITSIRASYLPKVELEPELEGQFEAVRRTFQDAVASRDLDTLASAREAQARFAGYLDAARSATDPHDASALRVAFDDYCARAENVSRRMISGEAGEDALDEMAAMQAQQQLVAALIAKTAAFDREELARAFAAVSRAQRTATFYQVSIGLVSLVAVLAISIGLIRSLLGSLSAFIDGFARFGEGDFTRPIAVSSRDELADVARHANSMAMNLDALAQARDKAEAALKYSNRELEAFSYSVAHDLRAPLRAVNGFSRALVEDCGDRVGDDGRRHLERIAAAAQRMGELIDALLALSRVSRADLRREPVDLAAVARAVVRQLEVMNPDRTVEFVGAGSAMADGDPLLLRAVLENLLGNAWKFTAKTEGARIVFGTEPKMGAVVYYVRDNGAGFDPEYAGKLFAPFQRLHRAEDFPGTGIGLATVQRIVHRHGGHIWADGAVGRGATFFFTLTGSSGDPS